MRPVAPPPELVALLQARASFVLAVHKGPDGDAAGAALGLAEALRRQGKAVQVVAPTPLPEHYRWLPGAEQFAQVVQGGFPALAKPDGGRRHLQFLAQFLAADMDFSADFLEGGVQPQAGFHAHHQQVQHVGQAQEDVLLPLLLDEKQKDIGEEKSETRGEEDAVEAFHGRHLLERVHQHDQAGQRGRQQDFDPPICIKGRVAVITRAGQPFFAHGPPFRLGGGHLFTQRSHQVALLGGGQKRLRFPASRGGFHILNALVHGMPDRAGNHRQRDDQQKGGQETEHIDPHVHDHTLIFTILRMTNIPMIWKKSAV